MAIIAAIPTPHGIVSPLYWRLNSFDQLPNRQPDGAASVPAVARFRSYLSEEAFRDGASFLSELMVEFTPAWGDMRAEAYDALRAYDPSIAEQEALDRLTDKLSSQDLAERTLAAKVTDYETTIANLEATEVEGEDEQRKVKQRISTLRSGITEMQQQIDQIATMRDHVATVDFPAQEAKLAAAQKVRKAVVKAKDA